MAQHRLGKHAGIDVVVSALDAQLEFMGSHRTTAIERARVTLERSRRPVRRCSALGHVVNAAPRG
jgi:hypothetical protein